MLLTYAPDCARAFIAAARAAAGSGDAVSLNVPGRRIGIPALVDLIEHILPGSGRFITWDDKPLRVPSLLSGSALRDAVGDLPNAWLADGVPETIAGYRLPQPPPSTRPPSATPAVPAPATPAPSAPRLSAGACPVPAPAPRKGHETPNPVRQDAMKTGNSVRSPDPRRPYAWVGNAFSGASVTIGSPRRYRRDALGTPNRCLPPVTLGPSAHDPATIGRWPSSASCQR